MQEKQWFQEVNVPNLHQLKKKETFEYTTSHQIYDIEIFYEQSGECYVIGIPKEGRLIVYGSPVVENPQSALQIVIDKIQKEGLESHESPSQDTP
jgi:hypothetical protein